MKLLFFNVCIHTSPFPVFRVFEKLLLAIDFPSELGRHRIGRVWTAVRLLQNELQNRIVVIVFVRHSLENIVYVIIFFFSAVQKPYDKSPVTYYGAIYDYIAPVKIGWDS